MTPHRTRTQLVALAGAAALLLMAGAARADVRFRVPLGDHLTSSYVSAYRDHGSGSARQDWHCGSKTYDGHDGTDMAIGGFAAMDAGRNVVAAAAGKVIAVHDGEFDRCTSGSCGTANYVKLRHPDGKESWYWHLKKFSIVVRNGQQVTCGQKLGKVGSSGHATGPHLHFEPKASATASSRDPFHGGCSGAGSWWVDQGDYRSLPGDRCDGPAPPPAHPELSLKATIDTLPDQERDFAAGGASAGIFDLRVGQTATVHVDLTNAAAASGIVSAGEVQLAVHASLRVAGWEIFDNHVGNRCGGDFCLNSASSRAGQPPHQDPGQRFALATDAISAGETKRITLTLEAVAETGEAGHAPVEAFVASIEGFYTKAAFDTAPSMNVMNLQTFNGGDLRVAAELDVHPADPPAPPAPPVSDDGETEGEAADGGPGDDAVVLPPPPAAPAAPDGGPAGDAGALPGEASAPVSPGPAAGAPPEGPHDLSGGCHVAGSAATARSPSGLALLLLLALARLARRPRSGMAVPRRLR